MNNITRIRYLLYRLKRDWGFPVTIMRFLSKTVDVKTGVQVVNEDAFKIKRAIFLPQQRSMDFAYDLSFIAANKNFTYGGLFDTSKRAIILDARDCGSYVPMENDRCIHDDERWLFAKCERLDRNVGFLIEAQNLLAQPIEKIEIMKSNQQMEINHANT